MDKRLSQLFDLSKQTGERLVVLPEDGGEPFVLLALPDYRRLQSKGQNVVMAKMPPAKSSVLNDNYEFEPVAYEESEADDVK